MHRHDLDLIAQYAEGSLTDDARARALVDTCSVCRAEYESHKAVLATLSGVVPATMTEHEKARLHRDVATELRSPKRHAAPARGLWPSWALGAVAALVVVAGVAGVLSQLNGSNAVTETFSEIGSSLSGGQDMRGEEAVSGGDIDEGPQAPSAEGYFFDDSTDFASIAKSVRASTSTTSNDSVSSEDTECLEATGLIDYRLVPEVSELTRLLVAVATDPDDSVAEVAFIDPGTCEVVHMED